MLGLIRIKPYLNALYIRSVRSVMSGPKDRIDVANAEQISRVIQAIAYRISFVSVERVNGWIRKVLDCNMGVANRLIMANLPNIENLVIGGSAKDYEHIGTMVRAIVEVQRDSEHPQA